MIQKSKGQFQICGRVHNKRHGIYHAQMHSWFHDSEEQSSKLYDQNGMFGELRNMGHH